MIASDSRCIPSPDLTSGEVEWKIYDMDIGVKIKLSGPKMMIAMPMKNGVELRATGPPLSGYLAPVTWPADVEAGSFGRAAKH